MYTQNRNKLTDIEKNCMGANSLQLCLTLCNPGTVTHQVLLSMGLSRQEYWSGFLGPLQKQASEGDM